MTEKPPTITFDDDKHEYTVDGQKVPSVSQILDECTPKHALTWWGFRVGLYAILEMIQSDQLNWPSLVTAGSAKSHLEGIPEEGYERLIPGRKNDKKRTVLESLCIEHRHHPNAVRDQAADRGTEVHQAIQMAGIEGRTPLLADFPEDFRPYLRAFSGWWLDQDPEFIEQEIIVCHRDPALPHRNYAGRFDLRARINDRVCLVDFKTTKSIYDSHCEQLRFYQLADNHTGQWVEDYQAPAELQVVRLGRDGKYETASANWVSPTVVYAALDLYDARQRSASNRGTLLGT